MSLLLLFAGAGTAAPPPPPGLDSGGGGGEVIVTRTMDVLETGRWRARQDQDELALILALWDL